MAKRPAADGDADCEGKRRRGTGRKQHLYLVLDDWDKGYSIHKLDIGAFVSDAGPGATATAKHVPLPDPAVLRLQVPAGDHKSTHFAAMDSKIVIMHTLYEDGAPPALVYDPVTAALAVGPRPSPALQDGFNAAVAVAGKLYTLKRRGGCQQHSFEVLSRSPARPGGADPDPRWSGKVEEWFWRTVASPPPFDGGVFVTGYAVHPDGRTIFVSVERMTLVDLTNPSTYSFDTERCEWKRHGDWLLPFDGEGLYDSQLDAWVGLCDDGFPCACDVPSCDGAPSMTPAPNLRVGKDMVFRRLKIAAEVALARVDNGEFCLVELQPLQGMDMLFAVGDDGRRALHVSVFGLRYDSAGELRTTNHRRAASYQVTKHDRLFNAKGFWM